MPDINMTNRIIQIHLSSWRYFALLTIPPLILAFNILYSPASAALLTLFVITHYYCWRLWLDERLFPLMHHEDDLATFDVAMAHLWVTKSNNTRSLAERCHGVRRLFYQAMFTLIILWLVSLWVVLFLPQTIVE